MDKKRVKIKDIAERVGVSSATVSLVLSGKGNVREETRKRILEVANNLGYSRSIPPHRENSSSINLLALIAFIDGTHPSGRFYLPLIQGVTDTIKKQGYKVTVDIGGELSQDKKNLRKKYLKEFHKDISGILLLSTWPIEIEEVLPLIGENKPVIFLETGIPGFNKNSVLIDHYRGAFEAVEYLIKLGHNDIAHITGTRGHPHAEARLNGYVDALKAYNIPIKEDSIIEGDFNNLDLVLDRLQKFLQSRPLPTAIFGANDNITLTAMKFIKNRGFKVPEDISFIGFDDTHSSSLSDPPLTTVKQPLYDVGVEGAKMLIELLETKKLFTAFKVLKAELIIRDSTSAPRR